MQEIIRIKILNPKVKTLLQELQHLELIEIDNRHIDDKKQEMAEKLEGINLKDIDQDELQKIINRR